MAASGKTSWLTRRRAERPEAAGDSQRDVADHRRVGIDEDDVGPRLPDARRPASRAEVAHVVERPPPELARGRTRWTRTRTIPTPSCVVSPGRRARERSRHDRHLELVGERAAQVGEQLRRRLDARPVVLVEDEHARPRAAAGVTPLHGRQRDEQHRRDPERHRPDVADRVEVRLDERDREPGGDDAGAGRPPSPTGSARRAVHDQDRDQTRAGRAARRAPSWSAIPMYESSGRRAEEPVVAVDERRGPRCRSRSRRAAGRPPARSRPSTRPRARWCRGPTGARSARRRRGAAGRRRCRAGTRARRRCSAGSRAPASPRSRSAAARPSPPSAAPGGRPRARRGRDDAGDRDGAGARGAEGEQQHRRGADRRPRGRRRASRRRRSSPQRGARQHVKAARRARVFAVSARWSASGSASPSSSGTVFGSSPKPR